MDNLTPTAYSELGPISPCPFYFQNKDVWVELNVPK